MKAVVSRIEHWAVRILCVLALVFVAFGHAPISLPAQDDVFVPDQAAYMLPDGSSPIVCVTLTDASGHKHGQTSHMHGCDACQIGATALLTVPTDIIDLRRELSSTVVLPPRLKTFQRRLFPANRGPRAPPFLTDLV